MPTALEHSRSFVRRAIASTRERLSSYGAEEGPEIKVEPFDATNASTRAGLLKLVTSVAANNRRKANFAAQERDKELNREYVRAQIANVRAQAESRQTPAAKTGIVTDQPITVGGKEYPAGTAVSTLNTIRGAARDEQVAARTGKITAAKTAIAQLDERIKREVPTHVAPAIATLQPYVVALTSGSPELRAHALSVLRKVTGRDFSIYGQGPVQDGKPQPLFPNEAIAHQKQAMGELEAWAGTRAANILGQRYLPERQKHQATIDEMEGGGGAAAPANDVDDPLGVLGQEP